MMSTTRLIATTNKATTITVRDGQGEVTAGGQEFPVYARQYIAAGCPNILSSRLLDRALVGIALKGESP